MNILRNIAIGLFVLIARLMVRLLSFNQINEIGKFLGSAYYLFSSKKKKRMFNELGSIFPGYSEKDIKKVIKRFFQCHVLNEIDVFLYPFLNKGNIHEVTEVEGLKHLDDALKAGKGVILIHAHFSNAQMLMPALGYRGYKVNQIGFSPLNVLEGVHVITGRKLIPLAHTWMKIKESCEQKLPTNFIYLKKDSLRKVYDCLNRNEVVAMSVDGVPGEKHVWDFLDRKTDHFMDGPVRIALKSGARLLPLFAIRFESGKHRIIIGEPLEIEPFQDKEKTVRNGVERFLCILQGYVRQFPWLYAKFFGYHKAKPFFIKDENHS
jgi:lauroyl/myristoyl acyltransferase